METKGLILVVILLNWKLCALASKFMYSQLPLIGACFGRRATGTSRLTRGSCMLELFPEQRATFFKGLNNKCIEKG